MDARTEYILVQQVMAGNTADFEKIVTAYSPKIIRLAYRLVGNREEAEDLAQEAFLRLYRALPGFRGDSSIGTWLYRTVSRLAIDFLRRERIRRKIFFFRRHEEEDPGENVADPGASPRERLLAAERRRHLRQALEQLSPQQRAVFILRHDEELPLREIAELLGLQEGTVKSHLHRAVNILRRELQGLSEL
jgi:RNA polymerase sigma-70 factor, ECF subfamily